MTPASSAATRPRWRPVRRPLAKKPRNSRASDNPIENENSPASVAGMLPP